MDIKHRITINTDKEEFFSAINNMGIDYKEVLLPRLGGKLITILILESNPNWNTLVHLLKIYKKFEIYGEGDQFETIFSDKEIKNADWLRLISSFEQGYPQPKTNWPIKQTSYDIICPKCCIYHQTNSIRLAKEPSLGRKSFLSLIWTGEILCTPEVILGLDKIQAKGFEVWDAVIHKTGKPSERVRQLFVPGITSQGVIIDDDLGRSICPVCGTIKYYPHEKGKMYIKREALLEDTDFILTHEWFGQGLLAWREILVSNRIARLILDSGWSGVRFKVVEVVS
jgi:hypothetical protein